MTASTWHADITLRMPESLTDEDFLFEILEAFAPFAPAASGADGTELLSISLALAARDANVALVQVQELLEHPLTEAGAIVALELRDEQQKTAQLAQPQIPELVGYAETAAIAGVSRQRARQLAEQPAFPPALVRTAQGPLYAKTAVEAWAATRNRSTGRRPATAAS